MSLFTFVTSSTKNHRYVNIENVKDPFEQATVTRFIPSHITRRITAQAGLFTIHPEPKADFRTNPNVTRLIVKKNARRPLKRVLNNYGIHRASLFPDLDGLAKHVEWLRTDLH